MKMKQILSALIISISSLGLVSCGGKPITTTKIEIEKPKLNIPNPEPLQLNNVEWQVKSFNNSNNFCLDEKNFLQQMSNSDNVHQKLYLTNDILNRYREYYEKKK